METFKTIDIYDTKGIEYLFIIGYLIVLIVFLKVTGKQLAITSKIKQVIGVLTASILKIPQGLFYSRNHTWAHLERSGNAKVGLDDLLMHITGDVKLNFLKSPGDKIAMGELLTEIEQQGKQLKIFSPISGEIMDANKSLATNPEILSNDPYEKGWIYQIKPSNWISETKSYYLADEAVKWMKREVDRFKDFLTSSMDKYTPQPSLQILQDGGEMRDKTLSDLPDEVWQDFQKNFLDKKD